MNRFDESIMPTIEEVREECAKIGERKAGRCQVPAECVVADRILKKIDDPEVRVNVYPGLQRGLAYIQWIDTDAPLHIAEQKFELPTELNRLARMHDTVRPFRGGVVTGNDVVTICNAIIADRPVAA